MKKKRKKTCKMCRGKKPGYRCWVCDDLNREAQNTQHPAGWPMASTALEVHPGQIGEATADAQAKGVPTEFTKGGRPIFTGPAHRRAYMKAYGYADRNGGYGDYTGTSYVNERAGMREEARQRSIRDIAEAMERL